MLFSFAVALYFRLQLLPRLTASKLFIGSNSYYHLRNIQYIIANFPNILGFDAYTQYPSGITQPLVPLYDLKVASVAYILGLGHPSNELIYNVCTYMPVAYAIITIAFTFFIAQALFDNIFAGILASLFMSVMPGSFLMKSMAGYNDNAIFEVMICSIMIYALVCCFKWLSYEKLTHGIANPERQSPYARAIAYSVMAGIAFSALAFDGSLGLIFIPILIFYFAIRNMMDYANSVDIEHQIVCSIAFFTSATTFSFLLYTIFPKLDIVIDDFAGDYLLVGVIIVCLIGIVAELLNRYTNNKKLIYYIVIPVSIAFIAYAHFKSPNLITLMPHITEPVFGTDLKSIFAIDDDLYSANFAICGYLAILSLGIIYIKKLSGISLFVFVWSIGVITASIFESRFAIFYAINVAVLSAYGMIKLWDFAIDKIKQRAHMAQLVSAGVFVITCIVLAGSIATTDAQITSILNSPNTDLIISNQWLDTLHWVANETPDPNIDINNEIDKPITYPASAYGILSSNVSGNYIQMIGKRMPVSSPYENESSVVSKFFAAKNESDAISALTLSNGTIKYVITDVKMASSNFSAVTGMNATEYALTVMIPNATLNITGIGFDNSSVSFPYMSFYNITILKLHIFDGNGLQHFRLVYESTSTHDRHEKTIKDMYNFQSKANINNNTSGDVKVFEYVKGATIKGKVKSNTQVNISTNVETNQLRIFNYTQTVSSDKDGNYIFVVPYAYGYVITSGDKQLPISVNDTEITEGLVKII